MRGYCCTLASVCGRGVVDRSIPTKSGQSQRSLFGLEEGGFFDGVGEEDVANTSYYYRYDTFDDEDPSPTPR